MGYVIHQLPSSFAIRRVHFPAALAAVHGLHKGLFFTGVPGSERQPFAKDRSFVSGQRVLACTTQAEALGEWRWIAIEHYEPGEMPDEEPGRRDIVELEFTGEKLGDDDALFATLAPFVDEGSFVAVVGEDGRVWQWVFRQGMCFRQEGRVVYDGPLGEALRPPAGG